MEKIKTIILVYIPTDFDRLDFYLNNKTTIAQESKKRPSKGNKFFKPRKIADRVRAIKIRTENIYPQESQWGLAENFKSGERKAKQGGGVGVGGGTRPGDLSKRAQFRSLPRWSRE